MDRRGDAFGQLPRARLGDDVVVLDPDAEAFLRQVNARLDREDHPRLEGPVSLPGIVGLKTEEMTGSVREKVSVAGPRQDLLCLLVNRLNAGARSDLGGR